MLVADGLQLPLLWTIDLGQREQPYRGVYKMQKELCGTVRAPELPWDQAELDSGGDLIVSWLLPLPLTSLPPESTPSQ